MREVTLERNTNETQIELTLNLDGAGRYEIDTGCGFLNHMLELFARHGRFDLVLTCHGDVEVDYHHTAEDIGIALGQAFARALGEMRGIQRYGSFYLPMDEALVLCAVDLSGRCTLNWDVHCKTEKVGDFDVECASEFWLGFARNVPATVHFVQFAGENTHHILEACFKGAGHALAAADLEPLLPDRYKIILHTLYVAQVDKVALVAPRKMVGGQLFFGLLQAAAHRPGIAGRVIVQQTVAGFEIQNFVGVQKLHTAAHLQGDLPAAAALDALQGALQFCAELVVADRFEHEVERIDLIPADGVLRHVGDKHQHDVGVHLTDTLSRGHAAQGGHLDIQKDDIKAGAVGIDDLGTVGKGGHVQLAAALARILCDEPTQLLTHCVVIFNYSNFCHAASPLSR